MIILGLAGSSHDSSAAVIADGEILAACEQERYSRVKHAVGQMPIDAAKACLRIAGISPMDVDLTTYYFDPELYNREIKDFIYRNKSILGSLSLSDEGRILKRGKKHREKAENIMEELGLFRLKYVPHHLAHAASSFYLSGLDNSMILTLDNIGEFASTMLAVGKGTKIKVLSEQEVPDSLGILYAIITDFLGFRPFFDEGKIMALASYGKPTIPLEEIAEIGNGQFRLKKPFFNIDPNSKRQFNEDLVRMYGNPRLPDEPITQKHFDLAASVQDAAEKIVLHIIDWMHEKTGLTNLCLGGGVALNCSINGKIRKLPYIDNLSIFPAAGDSGTSLGSALYEYVQQTGEVPSPLTYAGLGESWGNEEVRKALQKSGFKFKEVDYPEIEACKRLLEEKVICWFNGRAEFGPRALGHRSILALPNSTELKDFINNKIKNREPWRPLCPSIAQEDIERYAEKSSSNRFMIVASDATDYAKKSVPGVIHIDGTMRIQSVYPEESPAYYHLLENIGNLTSNPVLLNTSFNLRTEPIVNSPEDAIRSFSKMPVKSMIIENFEVHKNGKD